jgi:hypothetical protein
MEKLDSLYKDKLQNAKIEPSDRANKLFMEKLEARNKKSGVFLSSGGRGYWRAAAAIFIFSLLGSVFYFYPSTIVEQVATISTINNINKEEESLQNQIQVDSDGIYNKGKFDSKIPFQNNKPNNLREIALSKSLEQSAVDDKYLKDASDSYKEKMDMDNQPTVSLKSETFKNVIAANSIAETLIIISPIIEEKMKINALGIDSLVSNEENEKPVIAKVFEEIKGLKKGEKLDFNKFGFKSLEEMAMHEEGFIASETRQIKEKFQWIKSKLTNN